MDLIIGSGVTGLSYAAFCGHTDYLILEKKIKLGDIVKLHAVMVMYGTIRGISFILWMQELRVS